MKIIKESISIEHVLKPKSNKEIKKTISYLEKKYKGSKIGELYVNFLKDNFNITYEAIKIDKDFVVKNKNGWEIYLREINGDIHAIIFNNYGEDIEMGKIKDDYEEVKSFVNSISKDLILGNSTELEYHKWW